MPSLHDSSAELQSANRRVSLPRSTRANRRCLRRISAAARWPLTTALSIVPGRPCPSSRPRAPGPRIGVSAPGRDGCPARARTSRASRGSPCRAAASPRARPGIAAGDLARRPRDQRGTVTRRPARPRRSTPATGATPLAKRQPLVEHPLHRAPGKADERSSITCRSYHRFTVTIGFDSIREAARRCATSGAGTAVENSDRSANHGTAETIAPAVMVRVSSARPPRISTPRTPPSSATTRARALVRTSPPRCSMYAPRRFRVHLVQRPVRQHHRRRLAVRAEHLRQNADERLRRRLVGRLVQRRDGQRLPQPLRSLAALPVRPQPAGHGRVDSLRDVVRCEPARAVAFASGMRAMRSTESRSPQRHRRPSAITAPSRCSGGGTTGSAAPIGVPRRSRYGTSRLA